MADCKIPEIPFASGVDQNLSRLLSPIKETLDIWAGRIGNPLCRVVTIEDLLDEAVTVNITSTGGSGNDADAIHDDVASEILAVALKAAPVAADLVLIEDSADAYAKKRVTVGTIVATGSTVKVSSNDTTAGYLEDKIVVSDGSNTTNILELSTLNDGADEDVRIQIDEAKINHANLLNLITGDPHTQYQLESEKSAANGYASLGATTLVPTAELGTGSASSANFLRGDGTWAAPSGSGDMLASVYDPTTIVGDAFDMDNMVEGLTTKVLTDTERTGIAANTSARHTQGTDTTLGVMTADINMNSLYQIVGLQAPAAAGEAIRQTVNITEADLETLTDGSNADALHVHAGGGGDVSKVGTPVDSQVGVWTGDGTIEGTIGLTYDGIALDITGNITLSGTVDGIDIATDVAANTLKDTNATHTGEVTGSGALALHNTSISNKTIVTALGSDYVLIGDSSDADNLKRALISDFASAGGDMAAATYDPATIAADCFDMDNMVEGVTTKILTATERSEIAANTLKDTNADHTGEVTGSAALTITADAVTYAKMQNVSATDRLLGRVTAGAGDVEEITCTAAGRALLDDADAAAQRTTLSLDNVENLKVNLVGTAPPVAATDDITLGYSVGSRWFDITNDKEYVCLDNADGAAVWIETTAAGAGSHTITSHSDVVDATGAQLEELTGGGDTTLHDHDGISENTAVRHASGSDTTLGTMETDIDMNSLYQVVGLQAPAAAGEAIRQTANITEANLETLTDNSIADALHRHSELVASDGSPDPALVVDAAGQVGIGQAVPTEALDVAGNLMLSGNSSRQIMMDTQTSNISHLYFVGAGDANAYFNFIGTGATSLARLSVFYGGTWTNNNIQITHDGTNGWLVTGAGDILLSPTGTTVNIAAGKYLQFGTGQAINEFSTDGTLAGDSDDAVPTEKAVKTYVDACRDVNFQAVPTAQQTNIAVGSAVTVAFGTERFDTGSDFASNIFTAPVTGKYILNVTLNLQDLDVSGCYVECRIVTSNKTYYTRFNLSGFSSTVSYWQAVNSVVADMDASDTAYIAIYQSSGTAQMDIAISSVFSGSLIC